MIFDDDRKNHSAGIVEAAIPGFAQSLLSARRRGFAAGCESGLCPVFMGPGPNQGHSPPSQQ